MNVIVSCSGFKLNIHVDDKKFGKPLQITHFPQIMGVDGVKCLKQINVSDDNDDWLVLMIIKVTVLLYLF